MNNSTVASFFSTQFFFLNNFLAYRLRSVSFFRCQIQQFAGRSFQDIQTFPRMSSFLCHYSHSQAAGTA